MSLKELIQALWRARWRIVLITVAAAAIAGVAALLMPKKYTARIVVSAISNTPGEAQLSGLSSLASQFGGLAALAGISIDADSRKSESLAVLQSSALTRKYIHDNNLLPVLFRDKWDARLNKWRSIDPDDQPTLWKANEFFRTKVRDVVTDPKTGLVTLEITWTDPHAAAEWANGLVHLTNTYLRDKAIGEAERNIKYLSEQASKTDIVGVKEAIYSLLQTEINKAMIARGSEEYALRVLDPAAPPERPSSPKPLIWILVAVLLCLVLAVCTAFVRLAWRKS